MGAEPEAGAEAVDVQYDDYSLVTASIYGCQWQCHVPGAPPSVRRAFTVTRDDSLAHLPQPAQALVHGAASHAPPTHDLQRV